MQHTDCILLSDDLRPKVTQDRPEVVMKHPEVAGMVLLALGHGKLKPKGKTCGWSGQLVPI